MGFFLSGRDLNIDFLPAFLKITCRIDFIFYSRAHFLSRGNFKLVTTFSSGKNRTSIGTQHLPE